MDKSTTGLLGAAFGMSIGILLIFVQGNLYVDSPAYYKEYYSDKKGVNGCFLVTKSVTL